MKKLLLVIMLLTGCADHHTWVVTQTATETATSTTTSLQQLINQENDYLESVGQHPLIPGLACNIYTVPTSTTSIVQATNSCTLTNQASYQYLGQFNQPNSSASTGLNILPTALQPVYQSWFIVKCNGYLINQDNNYHQFSLTSDDGSLLYVDGLLVNNDGLHSTQTVSNSKMLTQGAHYFEIDFFQATGMQSLILQEDGHVVDASQLYH